MRIAGLFSTAGVIAATAAAFVALPAAQAVAETPATGNSAVTEHGKTESPLDVLFGMFGAQEDGDEDAVAPNSRQDDGDEDEVVPNSRQDDEADEVVPNSRQDDEAGDVVPNSSNGDEATNGTANADSTEPQANSSSLPQERSTQTLAAPGSDLPDEDSSGAAANSQAGPRPQESMADEREATENSQSSQDDEGDDEEEATARANSGSSVG
ncbi:hypothetical protein ACFVMC_13180 [Nocardia sp. NPDC127579]|uniref:hypothetical protein n=1 Tax=Nocardia sp. NPDC127579 TaxID=3345402 RepID=UPI00363C622E